jgi:hypothetical protein
MRVHLDGLEPKVQKKRPSLAIPRENVKKGGKKESF